jgi:hypothetical protein
MILPLLKPSMESWKASFLKVKCVADNFFLTMMTLSNLFFFSSNLNFGKIR